MTSGSENSKLLPAVIPRSTFAGAGDEGGACREFQQAEYPFKWRKHVCTRCRRLRAEHRASSGKATVDVVKEEEVEERHLPPRKRLVRRFQRFQRATLAAFGSKVEKEEELEEGEIRRPAAVIAKEKRRPRRKRWDVRTAK